MTTGWTPFERERRRWVEELSYPTVLHVRRGHDPQLRHWAEATQRFVYIGRTARGGYKQSKWHNPHSPEFSGAEMQLHTDSLLK